MMVPRASVLLPLLLGLAWAQYEETIEHLFPAQSEVIHDEREKTQMYEKMMGEMPKMEGGQVMFQGDMMMTERDLKEMYALQPSRDITWPGGIVPYKIDESSANEADLIRQGIAHWMNNSCLTFRELQKEDTTTDFILFFKGKGCWSRFGHIGSVQNISIGEGCERFSAGCTIDLGSAPKTRTPETAWRVARTAGKVSQLVHEIGHAIGFLHEQSRADRDRFIKVNYPNIETNYSSQFDPDQNKREYGARYDYTSVMHYSPTAFAASPEMKTLIPVNPMLTPIVRRHNGLTFRDRRKANFLYQCDAACASKPRCENEGFVDNNCKCVCPPNTGGERCERLRRSYYSRPNCGGRVIRETTIASPGYPNNQRPQDGLCVWWVQAPANMKVQLTFPEFDLYDRTRGFCIYDRLEIRLQSLYRGKTLCSNEIEPNNVFTSVGPVAIIEYRPYVKFKRGFSAKVKFVPA